VFNLHVHLVFVTKYRRDVLNDAMLTRCEQVMRDVCVGTDAELREFNGEHDHVHLLVHYPPKLPISALVNSLKGVSAHYLRKEFTGRINRHIMHGHLWSPSYFAASCGGAPPAVGQGVHRQPEASRSITRFLPALN
jgi:REP-associated tyrosine transposase